MTVAVHIAVGVRRDLAGQVEGVFVAVAEEDRNEDEDADHNSVADKFVAHDGLNEKRQEHEGEDLRIGDDEEFLEVLADFVVVVAEDGLHENAAGHSDDEKNDFGDGEREEFAEPVGGFAHGKRVVDAVEMGIAFTPDEFGGVERGDDVEEESGRTFDGLHHEIGDGPGVPTCDATREVAVVDGEGDEERSERPKWNFAKDVGEAERRKREKLTPSRGGVEHLMNERELGGENAALGARIFLFYEFSLGRAALATDGRSEEH